MTEEKKDELKQGDDPSGDVQPDKQEVEDKKPEGESKTPSVEELQKQLAERDEKLAKIQSDNENYKQAIIAKNAKDFSLGEEEKPEPKQEIKPEIKEEISEDEEAKAWEKVRKETEKVYEEKERQRTKAEEKHNERIAVKKFFKENPHIATNEAMKAGVKEFYVNRNGKSIEGIKMDMEDALEYWAFKNKVDLKPVEKNEKLDKLGNMPAGGGGEPHKPGDKVNQAIFEAFPELANNPKLIEQYKEKIKNGEIEVTAEERDLLFN